MCKRFDAYLYFGSINRIVPLTRFFDGQEGRLAISRFLYFYVGICAFHQYNHFPKNVIDDSSMRLFSGPMETKVETNICKQTFKLKK